MRCAHKWIGNICSKCGAAWNIYAQRQVERMEYLGKNPRENLDDALWIFNHKPVTFEEAVDLSVRADASNK